MRAALLFALVMAGCASAPGGPGAVSGPAACAGGEGDLFLAASYGGGFVAATSLPRLVEISHNGTIRVLQGYTRAGNGSVVEDKPGSLHALSVVEARAMLSRANVSLDGRDMVVTRGDRAVIPEGLYEAFCDHVTSALPKLRDEYPATRNCADEGSMDWNVWTTSGHRHIRVDDCADDATDFQPLRHEFDTLVGPG